MICPNCKSSVADTAAYCENCHMPVSYDGRQQTGIRAAYKSLAMSPLFIVSASFLSLSCLLSAILGIDLVNLMIKSSLSTMGAKGNLIKLLLIFLGIVPFIVVMGVMLYGMWDLFASATGKGKKIRTSGIVCLLVTSYIRWVVTEIVFSAGMIALGVFLMMSEKADVFVMSLMAMLMAFVLVLISIYYYCLTQSLHKMRTSLKQDDGCKSFSVTVAVYGFTMSVLSFIAAILIFVFVEPHWLMMFTVFVSSTATFLFSIFILTFNAAMKEARRQARANRPINMNI